MLKSIGQQQRLQTEHSRAELLLLLAQSLRSDFEGEFRFEAVMRFPVSSCLLLLLLYVLQMPAFSCQRLCGLPLRQGLLQQEHDRTLHKRNLQMPQGSPCSGPQLAHHHSPQPRGQRGRGQTEGEERGPPATYRSHVRAPPGVTITVSPAVLKFKRTGEEKAFKVFLKPNMPGKP